MLEGDIKRNISQIEWDLTEILFFCIYKCMLLVNFALYKAALY